MAYQEKDQRSSQVSTVPEKENSGESEAVLITISGEGTDAANVSISKNQTDSTPAPRPPNESSHPSPEISLSSPSPNKLPKMPATEETLTRRRSVARSAYSNPKVRFGEQPNPVDAKSRSASSSPRSQRTPLMASPIQPAYDEDDDEEEIYRKVELSRRKVRRRIKTMAVIKWVVFLCTLGCLLASLTVKELQKDKIWGFELWRWSVLLVLVVDGLFATKCLTKVIVFLVERNFLLRKKVLYFVHGLKRSFMVFIWAASVIITWVALFNHCVKRSKIDRSIFNYVTRNIAALVIGTFLWFLKSLWVRMLASKFHVNVFFDRIQESIFHQYVLQTLSGPPLIEEAERVGRSPSSGMLSFRRTGNSQEPESKRRNVIDAGKLVRMKGEQVSSWTMKLLIDVVKNSGLSIISFSLDDEDMDGGQDREIKSEMEAVAAAYHIFRNVASPSSKYIEEEDLYRFLIKEEVDIVFPLFEGSDTGRIDRKALTDWVVGVYRNRKALSQALNDTHIIVRQLNKFVTWIVVLVAFNVWLLLVELSSTQVLVSQLLGAAFIFGNTCKNMFEGLMFAIFVHPYDVGDRCVVDGVVLLVEELNMFTTVFLKIDNEKVYYPNSLLATKPISNYYRSPDMGETVEFTIDISTPLEMIALLKERIKRYLERNPSHWHPNHNVVVKDIQNESKLRMAVNCCHTINFQRLGERNRRRTELVMELKRIFEDLGMKFSLLREQVDAATEAKEPPNATSNA